MVTCMNGNNPAEALGLPDPTDPSEVVRGAEPEIADGPLGIPLVKPRGLDLPGDKRY